MKSADYLKWRRDISYMLYNGSLQNTKSDFYKYLYNYTEVLERIEKIRINKGWHRTVLTENGFMRYSWVELYNLMEGTR